MTIRPTWKSDFKPPTPLHLWYLSIRDGRPRPPGNPPHLEVGFPAPQEWSKPRRSGRENQRSHSQTNDGRILQHWTMGGGRPISLICISDPSYQDFLLLLHWPNTSHHTRLHCPRHSCCPHHRPVAPLAPVIRVTCVNPVAPKSLSKTADFTQSSCFIFAEGSHLILIAFAPLVESAVHFPLIITIFWHFRIFVLLHQSMILIVVLAPCWERRISSFD